MKIKIYTIVTCAWCDKLKAWLGEKKVDFEEVNLTEEYKRWGEVLEKTGKLALPLTLIEETPIVGYDVDELAKTITA